MSDHSRFVALAKRLIPLHGRDINIVSVENYNSEYDPTLVESSITVKAVDVGFRTSEVDGSVVKKGDHQYLIDSDVVPDVTGHIIDKGSRYSILDFIEIAPGDQSIMYKVHAR